MAYSQTNSQVDTTEILGIDGAITTISVLTIAVKVLM